MKKRIVSALLALVLILSNFTGGGLIEHVHVEAAELKNPITLNLHLYNDYHKEIVIEKAGMNEITVNLSDIGGTMDTFELSNSNEWNHSVGNWNPDAVKDLPVGTVVESSITFDGVEAQLTDNAAKYTYDGTNSHFDICYYTYLPQFGVDKRYITNWDTIKDAKSVTLKLNVILPDDPTALEVSRSFTANDYDSGTELIDITSQILSAADVESLDLVESFSITIEASDTSKWSHSTQGDKAPSYEVLINGPAWSSTGTAVRQFISCESAKQVIDISKEEFDTAYTAAIAKGAVEKILINPYAFDPAKSPVTFKISVTAVAGESKIKPEPEDFAAPNNKLYLFVGQEDANSSVEITDYKDGYELSYTVPDGGVKDITTNSWLTIKSVSNVQGKESTTIPDTAAIDVTKVVITDEAGEVHTYESFVKDVLTGDLSALEPYRTVKGQDGLFVISIFDNFDWTDDEQHIVDMATKIKSVTVYFNVVDLTKVETVHPDGEVVLSLDDYSFPLNNGPFTFPIRNLSKDDKITVHVIGTSDADFRFYLIPGTDKNWSGIVKASDLGFDPAKDKSFDLTFELTVIPQDDSVEPATLLQVKGSPNYNNPLENLTITHLAIVYPPLECKEDHDGWSEAKFGTITPFGSDTFCVPFADGDEAYPGDTIDYCIIGTTDVDQIRAFVAKDLDYSNNLLNGSAIVGSVENGEFWLKGTTTELFKADNGSVLANYFYFKAGNDSAKKPIESLGITHFYYKINHKEHEHTPLEGTYKPVEGDDTQHTYECSICHQTITESHVETLVIKGDASGHYDYCVECGYTGEIQPHDEGSYTANNDGKTHTVNCETCGYKNESEEHVESKNKYDEDDVGRYHVCEYCGGRMDETKHDYEWVADEDGIHHHEECKTCHHKKTGSTEEHDYKNGKCSKCDYNHPEDEHVWGSWTPDFGGTTHTRTCSICGKEDTDPHNLPEKWTPSSEDETKHLKKCPDCGYEVTGEHNFGDSYEYVDAETHMQTCADCKKTVTSSHNYEEGKYSNSTTDHWQICKDCKGESDRENHKYVNGSEHCSVCNYWNHQHTMKWMDDGENHWEECTDPDCDYKTEKEPHVFDGSYDYNSTQHSQTCSVCHAKVSEAHTLVDEYDDDFHWKGCEICDYETRPVRHTLKTDSDENGHWEYCENCKYKSDPVAHTPEKELGHDADSHWSICSECGKVYNKTAHTPSDELKHDSEGHWTVCSVCGYESTEKKEHTWDDGEITVEPTETTEGVKTYTCTECGETKTETVPKSAHKHVAGEEWKYDENTHWHECVSETCDDKTAKLDEAAHTEDEGTVTKAATETEEGVKTYKCTVCGAVTRTETIPKEKHTHVAGEEWKYDEKTHWHECVSETCDDKSAKLDEAEHVWDDGKITVEPTYTKEGEKLYTCEVCGETKTETVPVNAHEHSTVTKSDEKGHWEECTICGETVGEVEAHTPGEWITDSEATSTEAGRRHKECTVCGYVTDVLEVPATGDIAVEVPTVGNVPKVELPAEQQEVLKNAIIDEEDVEAIENGSSIDIELTVENAESTIAPEDKAKSDEAAVQGNYTHVRYLDINLTKVVTDANGASTSEEISELGKEVRIVITVPLALAKPTGRDFAVIRVHDGEAAVLKDLDSDPNTVTISTNLFSSYTLVYVDTTPVPSTPGGLIGHVHVITGLQNDAHYHWRGCFICSMRVDYEPHRFIDGVCTVCGYRDPNYVPEVEEEEPAEEVPDTEVTVVDAPAEGTEQGGDSEETPEVTDTPADLPETEAEVVEVKEDDETSENPETGVVFTGIGAVMAAIAALIAKRK